MWKNKFTVVRYVEQFINIWYYKNKIDMFIIYLIKINFDLLLVGEIILI